MTPSRGSLCWYRRGRWPDVLALLAGVLLVAAFAPLDIWPLALLAPALLFLTWLESSPRRALWLGWLFGLGLFGAGVSWVYVAIHEQSGTPPLGAALLTFAFVAFLALYPALTGWLAQTLARRFVLGTASSLLLLFPAAWLAVELLRAVLLTGFPWLSLGYALIDTPLAAWAPLFGVFGLSLLAATSAGVLAWWVASPGRGALVRGVSVLVLLWGLGGLLGLVQWSEPYGEVLRVSLVQGNVPQMTKWDPDAFQQRLDRYADLTLPLLGERELVVWPENAITMPYQRLRESYFDPLQQLAEESGTDILLGLPVDAQPGRYYTSIASLGSSPGLYHKRHLVPFGEYVPLESLLRGLISFFDIPMSSFVPGADEQSPLRAAGQVVAPTVCYEDAFGSLVAGGLPEATLLVNASNNAWYGDSLAPHQHLQISRLRTLETGRPLLRATTNGISALVDHRGRVIARSAQFRTEVVDGRVQPMQGSTAYVLWGEWPLYVWLLGVWLLGRWLQGRAQSRRRTLQGLG